MIAFLRGKLLLWREEYLVLDVHGVGYRIFVPTSTLHRLPTRGEEMSFSIYTAVREDAILLYGFQTEGELDLFKLLISVTGIGPKVAMGILSAMEVNTFKRAILYEDLPSLKKTPGIGDKTAKRLILELKTKISQLAADSDLERMDGDQTPTLQLPIVEEAVDALMALGYSRGEAYYAVEQVKEKEELQKLIRSALKYLGQGRNGL